MNTILKKLFLWQKFAILGILAAVLVSVPLVLYIHESNKSIAAVALEIQGVVPARTMLKTVQLVQQHRGLSALVVGRNETALSQRTAKMEEAEKTIAAMDAIIKKDINDAAISDAWQQAKNNWTTLAGKVSQRQISVKGSF